MKPTNFLIVFCLSILAIPQAFSMDDCTSVDQSSAVGKSCRTSLGFEFVRVKNGWKDQKGKTWFDESKTGLSQREAKDFCSNNGEDLPSRADFQLAASHGISELLRDAQFGPLWSSDICMDDPRYAYNYAYTYSITTGEAGELGYRDSHYGYVSTRCVSR